jgi:hypothetical protein
MTYHQPEVLALLKRQFRDVNWGAVVQNKLSDTKLATQIAVAHDLTCSEARDAIEEAGWAISIASSQPCRKAS